MISFKDKILLITGGTGSFGNAVLRRFLTTDIAEIRILSRDEKKQDDMRHTYQELYPQYAEKIKFYIGDVRDYNSILNAFRGVDYVFHAAALKQVPSCEFYPMEAVKTNVAGSDNVISACVANHVKKAIFLSTDKAAYPINAMGMTKAVMEKNVIARSRQMLPGDPVLCLTRYGNVMASRGSVIPLFCDRIDEGKPLTITNPNMTRFMMTLSDAVDLVLYAFEHGEQGDLFVQKAPAATIETLAQAVLELKHSNLGTTIIGTRHGEKLFEVLVTAEEMMRAEDLPGFFRIPADNRDLNYDNYFSKGNPEFGKIEQYTSHNTHRLNVEEMKQLLLKLKLFGGTADECTNHRRKWICREKSDAASFYHQGSQRQDSARTANRGNPFMYEGYFSRNLGGLLQKSGFRDPPGWCEPAPGSGRICSRKHGLHPYPVGDASEKR